MIKAVAGDLLILGLSDGNLERLRKNEPIVFSLNEIGMGDGRVMIFWGPTEEAMKTLLSEFLARPN